jgi:hypothetical protein
VGPLRTSLWGKPQDSIFRAAISFARRPLCSLRGLLLRLHTYGTGLASPTRSVIVVEPASIDASPGLRHASYAVLQLNAELVVADHPWHSNTPGRFGGPGRHSMSQPHTEVRALAIVAHRES